MTDLMALVVTITTPHDTFLPANAGRSVYGLLMRWLEEHSSELAEYWHNAEGIKPYTCSTVVGLQRHSPEQRLLKANQTAWFRITALNSDIAEVLQARLANPPGSIDLDEQPLAVVSMTADPAQHVWAGMSSYQAISSAYLLAQATPPRRFGLEFVAPTTFKQNNLNQPFPTPDLVYGSLTDRWNAFSPIGISSEFREFARWSMVVNQFDIQSVTVTIMNEGKVEGTVGKVHYRTARYDRYWQSMAALLTEYAFYSGVGRYTTMGMGQTRHIVKSSGQS